MAITESLYVPDLAPALKHPTVFKKFDALKNGEGFILINDHDPIPLYYELKAERGDIFEWEKIENGPEVWRVEIKKKPTSQDQVTSAETLAQASAISLQDDVCVLNVTLLEPRLKHPTIFKQFDALQPGEAFQILNDHDPKPLYYQMIAERGNVFSWKYLKQGPQWWQVEIRKNEVGETVGEIAAKDLRKAEVFKKYGIDFCCGGKKSLKQACEEANVDPAVVEAELNRAEAAADKGVSANFTRWDADFLADYIYNEHHRYYYEEGPIIGDLAEKVAARHGAHLPQLFAILTLYRQLQQELQEHFLKEEQILFPFIKSLAQAKRSGDFSAVPLASIKEPIQMMELDHEAAGSILAAIRQAADNYTAPANACQSFQLLYKKLEAFESDLHQHVHLENNILFPKALELSKHLPI